MSKFPLDKFIGCILLILGLGIIFYSAFSVFRVYTGKEAPFNLFSFAGIALDVGKAINPNLPAGAMKQELISSDLLNKPMNLFAHVILMGFIASIGFKVANLGVMLVRTINVSLKEEKGVTA